jgi:hypothetical protein
MQVSYQNAILKRTSVRSYKSNNLDKGLSNQIIERLSQANKGPLGTNISFELVYIYSEENRRLKLGTYGFIKGAANFIVGQVKPSPIAFLDYGYLFEKVILELTMEGLGTCWLGGTFDRGEFAKSIDLEEENIIPAISPVGYPTDSRSLGDRIIRLGAGSRNRKAWENMFFKDQAGVPLSMEGLDDSVREALEMVRLAPSASNLQPWRIIAREDVFDIYLQRKPGYRYRHGKTDLQIIDIGIAMCHFDLTGRENGLKPNWKISSSPEIIDGWEYVISVKK